MKKLSIITINYNDAKGLRQTLDSVINQTTKEFEYIVVDGNSNDGSVDVLKTIEADNFKYISEADTGIYNAMNKGIKMASGEYLLFLNSGDILYNTEVIANVTPYFSEDHSILSGHIVFDELNGKRLREHPERITFSYLAGNAISHPSTFIKRDLFLKYGNYDENFKIVSDWAFFLKVLGLNNESYLKLPITISVFDTKGISSQEENFTNVTAERRKVLESYFPRIFNNQDDTYVFNKFIAKNKRFKYLKTIDESPFFRKLATLQLGVSAKIINLFRKRQ